MICPPLNINVA
jgi:WD40 repeat protein